MNITSRDIRNFFIGFIIGAILYLLYGYMKQLEAPLWMLQSTFYALMTAIFGFVFLGVLAPLFRDYLKEARMKKIQEKKALESLKEEYNRCAWSIENNTEKYIEKNELTNFEARLHKPYGVEVEISEELKRQVQEYNEKVKLYSVLRRASEFVITSYFQKRVMKKFPKTLKKPYRLDLSLQSDFLMPRYFNGEKVNESWLSDTHPVALKNITKEIAESERDELNTFFHELNENFKGDDVLRRFRKEKEEVIKYGKEIIAKLQKEIKSLNEQLKKYKNLRTSEGEKIPTM